MILGDFNLSEINWQNLSYVESESKRLTKFTEDNFLYQHVTEPTRGTNILDLILTNQEFLVRDTKVREHLGTCDHNMIEFEINTQSNNSSSEIYIPNFRKADYDNFNKALGQLKLKVRTLSEVWTNFKDEFLMYQNKFVFYKIYRIRYQIIKIILLISNFFFDFGQYIGFSHKILATSRFF